MAIYGADYKEQIFKNIMNTEFYVLLGKIKGCREDIPVCMGGIWQALNPDIYSINPLKLENSYKGEPSPLPSPYGRGRTIKKIQYGGGETQINAGICWLMCTDKIKYHIKSLLKELKTEIEKADEQFAFTYNFIFKENKQMKKWLKGLGFIFDNAPAEKTGIKIPDGFEFFYRLRGGCP